MYPNESAPFTVHSDMFIPVIQGQGSNDQKDTWLPKCYNHEIWGTYAQSELGHGREWTI